MPKKALKSQPKTTVRVDYVSSGICRDIQMGFQEIQGKNRSKIIRFLIELSTNGGNQTKAAIEAGLGNPNNRDISQEKIEKCAATAATSLLKKPEVKKVYDLINHHNDLNEIVKLMARKDTLIALLFEHAMYYIKSDKPTFRTTIELIAKLQGMTGEEPIDAKDALQCIKVVLPEQSKLCKDELLSLQKEGFFDLDDGIVEGEIVGEG